MPVSSISLLMSSIALSHHTPLLANAVVDYPDVDLIRTLHSNVARNHATRNCTVVPHTWGTNPSALLPAADVVLAADTLWDPALHGVLLRTMCAALGRTARARAHVVAGLHTGRYSACPQAQVFSTSLVNFSSPFPLLLVPPLLAVLQFIRLSAISP